MNTPRVSVITPTFRNPAMMREAVKSALAQTMPELEVLIVDDGSQDDTPEVVEKCFGQDPRVRYFYKENGGMGDARNFGIKKARGEWIAFLDHDDIWLPEKLEEQMRVLAADPEAGMCFSDAEHWGGPKDGSTVLGNNFSGDTSLRNYLDGCFIPMLSSVVRKTVFEKLGPFRTEPEFFGVDDAEFWMRFLMSEKAVFVDRVLCRYRVHESNVHVRMHSEMLRNILGVYRLHYDELKKRGFESQVKRRMDRLHRKAAEGFFREGRYVEARPHILAWLKSRPLRSKPYRYLLRSYFNPPPAMEAASDA